MASQPVRAVVRSTTCMAPGCAGVPTSGENSSDDGIGSRLRAACKHGLCVFAPFFAAAIREYLRAGDKYSALREFIQLGDNLASERGLGRGVLGLAEPEPTGDLAWDAALVELRLSEDGLPAPAWVSASNRRLKTPRTLDIDPADPIPSPDDVPAEFFDRGVLVWRDTLASV